MKSEEIQKTIKHALENQASKRYFDGDIVYSLNPEHNLEPKKIVYPLSSVTTEKNTFVTDVHGTCVYYDGNWANHADPMSGVAPSVSEVNDEVNKPAHYTDGKIEVIDFIEDKKLGFHLGNTVKYVARAGKKDPTKTIQDLEKAKWYLEREINRLKSEQ